MKKNLALLLATLLIVSLFAACGGGSGAGGATGGKPTTVQFWGHVNPAWNKSHETTIAKFNASQSDIVVEPTFFPYDDFEAKIQTSLLSGGAGADLYEIWGGWALDFVAANALSAAPDALVADLKNDCYEPVLGALYGNDGNIYGIPVEYNIEYGAMLVNKPVFEELGIPYPQTWDEMISVAKETAKGSGEIMEMRGIEMVTNDTLTTVFLSMILSQGGEYFVDGKFSLNTPEAKNALQTLVDYITVDHLTNLDSATFAVGADIESYHFLGRGEAMIVPRGPWVISDLDESYELTYGKDFDYIPMPFYSSVKAFPAETGWSMCVPKNAKAADAAWVYASFFMEKENLEQHNIACAQMPPRKSIVNDPDFVKALPYAEPLLPVLQYGKFIGPFNTDILKFALRDVYVSLCTNDGTYANVDAALAALQDKLNTDMKLG